MEHVPRRRGMWPWVVSLESIDCPNSIIFSADAAADWSIGTSKVIQIINRHNQGNNETEKVKETRE